MKAGITRARIEATTARHLTDRRALRLPSCALGAEEALSSTFVAAGVYEHLQRVLARLHRNFARCAAAAAGEQPHPSDVALGLALIHDRRRLTGRAALPAAGGAPR